MREPRSRPLKAPWSPQISKPLMEKKRRARINVSLEQLRFLLEKHYSHQVTQGKGGDRVGGRVRPSILHLLLL